MLKEEEVLLVHGFRCQAYDLLAPLFLQYCEPEHKGRRAWGERLIRISSRDQKEARVPLDSQRHTPSGPFFLEALCVFPLSH